MQSTDAWWKLWKKRRYIVAGMAFLGFINVYALRVNVSIAVVAMTENKSITLENGTVTYGRAFDWDSKMQGYILSSFFYGYITTMFFGGWLSARIGGKKVLGFGVIIPSALSLITPWLASTHVYLFIAVRVLQGIFEGVTYPSIHAVWARWAPPMERSRLATVAFSGCYVGTVVAMPLCAILSDNFGWEAIFYFFGAIALFWSFFWMVFIAETPAEDKYISQDELQYIQDALGAYGSARTTSHPWKAILTSMPVWAITLSHFGENWGFYTMLTQLPKFMKDTLDFDLKKAGFMSALPYLAMTIFIQISGQLADRLQEKKILTTTQVRKYFNCGGFIAQTIFMLAAGFWLDRIGTTLCITLAIGLGGFAWSGFSVNYLDLGPQHASVIMGIGNTFGTIPGIISPIITGYIVTTPTAAEWQNVFYITSGVYLVCCVFYGVFASGELQPWAKKEEDEKPNSTELVETKI